MSRLVTNAIRSTAASSDAMTIDSAGKPSFPNGGVGKILQVVNTQTGEFITGTTTIPDDDTIPQITEGFEVMTRTITPTNVSNTLLINVSILL